MLFGKQTITPHFPFPEFIDNSARSTFRKCPLNWAYAYGRLLGSKTPNVHLHAGGAFAFGLETCRKKFFDEGLDAVTAEMLGAQALLEYYGDFECPESSAKTSARMLGAYAEYWLEYPLEANPVKPLKLATGKHAIEFTFSIPLPIRHPVTGNPLLYAGRFDMLGEMDKTLFAVDEKTASQLGQQWMNNWALDAQFTGYIWAARQFGYPVAGAIIRGVSILKEKYGHAQAITYRSDYQIDRWYENLCHDVSLMIEYWKAQWYPSALDKAACNSYGGCSFKGPCDSPNPELWIEQSFARREWNPLHKGA
jgi:hypothetical protein